MTFDSDVPDTVPVWEITGDRRAVLKRPTSYFRDSKKFLDDHARQGIIGYIVKNSFGVKLPMTMLVARRMEDKFASGELEIVDYLRNHHAAKNAGLHGFDTESTSEIHQYLGRI